MKMSIIVNGTKLGGAPAGVQTAAVLNQARKRFFYFLRKTTTGVLGTHSGPQAPVIRERPRVEYVTPTADVIELRNRWTALADDIANPNTVDQACEAVASDFKERTQLVGPSGTISDLNRARRTGILQRPRTHARRTSEPGGVTYGLDQATQCDQMDESAMVGTTALGDMLPGVEGLHVEPGLDTTIFIPKRKTITKLVKDKRSLKVHGSLLSYLRCKYHLAQRDQSHINRLVHEARTWLIKSGRKCESDIDYTILASAVSAAFLVSDEELEFRAIIKSRRNYDNMSHLNATLRGDLGRTLFPLKSGGAKLFRGAYTTNHLPSTINPSL